MLSLSLSLRDVTLPSNLPWSTASRKSGEEGANTSLPYSEKPNGGCADESDGDESDESVDSDDDDGDIDLD